MKFADYKCPVCSQTFASSANTKQHIRQVHPDFLKGKEVMCYQCNTKFPSLSAVRSHQWVAHKEMYTKKVEAKKHPLAGRKRSLKAIAKFKATVKAKKLLGSKELTVRQVLNGAAQKPQLSAFELLAKFKEQRDLMITVCNMIEGVINQ